MICGLSGGARFISPIYCKITLFKIQSITVVRFASFFSSGFITAIVVNPPESKLAKRTSVQWCVLPVSFPVAVQLNLHETDLLFWYLSHHLTWHCLLIYGFSPCLPVLVCCDHKIMIMLGSHRKSWKIVRNQLKISCQKMANILKL